MDAAACNRRPCMSAMYWDFAGVWLWQLSIPSFALVSGHLYMDGISFLPDGFVNNGDDSSFWTFGLVLLFGSVCPSQREDFWQRSPLMVCGGQHTSANGENYKSSEEKLLDWEPSFIAWIDRLRRTMTISLRSGRFVCVLTHHLGARVLRQFFLSLCSESAMHWL